MRENTNRKGYYKWSTQTAKAQFTAGLLVPPAIKQTPLADWTDQRSLSDRVCLGVGALNWAANGQMLRMGRIGWDRFDRRTLEIPYGMDGNDAGGGCEA